MKSPVPAERCPCESGLAYAACCGRYHGGIQAPTPEALMRSRYSAYARQLHQYLLATWHPSTRPPPEELADGGAKWLGLKILGTQVTAPAAGTVEFLARYRTGGGTAVRLHELSRFVREDGSWLYVDGDHRDR